MLVPNRHGSSNSYRYGFQGQEKDDELKGEGNSLNYTFRMHDPRVGRFFAVDPLFKEYPELTPYQFASNSVIDMIEIEGLEGGWIVDKQGVVDYAELGPVPDTYFTSYNEASNAARLGLSKPSQLALWNENLSRKPSIERPKEEVRSADYKHNYYSSPQNIMAYGVAVGVPELSLDLLTDGGFSYVKNTRVFKTIANSKVALKAAGTFKGAINGTAKILNSPTSTKLTKNFDLAGEWKEIKRGTKGIEFQSHLSGKPIVNGNSIEEFYYNGVHFDGYSNGILFDSKDGYGSWFQNGKMKDWVVNSGAGKKIADEANRQINAANGNKLQWIFSDMNVVEPMRNFLKNNGVDTSKIEFKHVPKP